MTVLIIWSGVFVAVTAVVLYILLSPRVRVWLATRVAVEVVRLRTGWLADAAAWAADVVRGRGRGTGLHVLPAGEAVEEGADSLARMVARFQPNLELHHNRPTDGQAMLLWERREYPFEPITAWSRVTRAEQAAARARIDAARAAEVARKAAEQADALERLALVARVRAECQQPIEYLERAWSDNTGSFAAVTA